MKNIFRVLNKKVIVKFKILKKNIIYCYQNKINLRKKITI